MNPGVENGLGKFTFLIDQKKVLNLLDVLFLFWDDHEQKDEEGEPHCWLIPFIHPFLSELPLNPLISLKPPLQVFQ